MPITRSMPVDNAMHRETANVSPTARTLRGGMAFFLSNGLGKLSAFLFLCIASRLLGTREFGVLALGLSIFSVLQAIATFGLPNTALRFLSGEIDHQQRISLGCIIILTAVSASCTATLVFWSADWIAAEIFGTSDLISPLRILAVGILFAVAGIVLRAVLQAKQQIRPMMIAELTHSSGRTVVLLAFLPWLSTVDAILCSVVISAGLSCLIAGFYIRRLPFRPVLTGCAAQCRKIAAYAAPSAVIGLSYIFALHSDRIMLGALSDSSTVAMYTAASSLAMVGTVLHGGMVAMFMPLASERHGAGATSEIHDAYQAIGRWVGLLNGLLLLGFVALGPVLLALFGNAYATAEGYQVLLLLALMYFVGTWIGPTGAFLQMTGGHKLELMNTFVFLVANLTLNAMLIPQYGALGTALATLTSGLLRNTCQYIEIRYRYSLRPISRASISLLVLTLAGAGTALTTDSLALRGLLSLSVASALVYQVARNATPEERQAFLSIVSRSGSQKRLFACCSHIASDDTDMTEE